jgi:hypothetical protein
MFVNMRTQDLDAINASGCNRRDDVAIERDLNHIFSGNRPVRRYPEIDHRCDVS